MSEKPPALWLMLDTETTGLLDTRPAVLEVAWMVVRGDTLEQLTPLRQRLTALPWRLSWPQRLGSWSHFDLPVLRGVGSQLPARVLHRRCADMSAARMVAGLPRMETVDPGDGVELDLQCPGQAGTAPHRAAADVRAAWSAAKDLRSRVGEVARG